MEQRPPRIAHGGSAQPPAFEPAGHAGIEAVYVERVIALTLLLILALGCILVLKPFLPALLWAVILSVSTWPLYVRLERLSGGRRSLSALIMITGVAVVLLLPVLMLGAHLPETATATAQLFRETLAAGVPPLPDWVTGLPIIGSRLQDFWATMSHDQAALAAFLQQYVGIARDALLALGGELVSAILQVALSLFLAFFFYRDGQATVAMLSDIMTRLSGARSRRLIRTAGDTITGVVQGVIGCAVVQGILMGAGLAAAGIPAAIVFGFGAFFLSLIPAALLLLWVPAAIWLQSQGDTGWAIFIAVWGLFVGSIENWLRPVLIGKRSEMPLALILLGILGGALVFGFLGIFLGPVLLAIGSTLLREWGDHTSAEVPPA